MKFRTLTFSLFIILSCSLLGQEYTIETVPNPKNSTTDNFVSNPDRLISISAETTINIIADSLEKHNGVEVAVILVNSIGKIHIKDFAVDLFNTWGIGKTGADNGLLILLVYDQRSVTFETGYGIEGDLPDAICKRIQMEQMIPHFKNDDYDSGMINGMRAVAHLLEKGAYEYTTPQQSFTEKYSVMPLILTVWIGLFILLFIILFLRFRSVKKGDPYEAYFKVKNLSYWALGLFFLSPLMIFMYGYLRKQKNNLRVRPRPCKKCGAMMNERLDEETDDNYLSPNCVFEEQLYSVDYDVWLCPSCHEIEVLSFPQRSIYSRCPSCKTVAYYKKSDIVLKRATTYSTGTGLRTFACKYCKHEHEQRYVIPRVSKSSSSGSSGGGSSSSSGGSWGGGSSGGGGATSSW